ncbi:MAG: hypothetical protein LBL66_10920 [Clostridiales bacterium]|jgi:hypothetical protein|nr:hypothetical protein [Clostridiales bacterium]
MTGTDWKLAELSGIVDGYENHAGTPRAPAALMGYRRYLLSVLAACPCVAVDFGKAVEPWGETPPKPDFGL